MATQQLTFTLASGIITVSPESLSVNEGDSVEITIVRPNTASIYCAMLFDRSSSDQDPFSSVNGDSTTFNLADGVNSTTINVSTSAAFQSDSYTIVLSGSDIYLKDPIIIIDR